jgi:hypothetical protein
LISLGSHSVTGYSDGTFINIAPHGDGVAKKVGADGEIVRSIDPDRSSTVTLTLLQTSPTVAFCQEMYDRDRDTGEGLFAVMVKDLKGREIFHAREAWVVNSPEREFAKADTDREIEIATGESTRGGA